MRVGVLQLTSVLHYQDNLNKILSFKDEIKRSRVEALFLPECFYSLHDPDSQTPHLVEAGNSHEQEIGNLAKDLGVYLLGGSALTRVGDKVFNRTYNVDPEGRFIPGTSYDKIHLFACNLKNVVRQESQFSDPGSNLNAFEIADSGFKLGQAICFDMRFPEMLREYSCKMGVNMISICAAFTVPTGKAHWHSLLRARAIENQCYVIACAQWGKHSDKVRTYGHSLIIDPWGEILSDAGEDAEKLIYADCSLDLVSEVRSRMNVLI